MVLPGIWAGGGVSAAPAAAASSGLFIPSLHPLTAPPRSCPILRSFFVPKISTTTRRTINQCQMLKPPMVSPYVSSLARDHAPERLRPGDDVHVHVLHFLVGDAARVHDRAEAVVGALLAREAAGDGEDLAQHRRVAVGNVVQAADVLLGNDHEMYERLRLDVVEREHVAVLVHLLARDLAAHDLAEDAIGIARHSSLSFSLRPCAGPFARRWPPRGRRHRRCR